MEAKKKVVSNLIVLGPNHFAITVRVFIIALFSPMVAILMSTAFITSFADLLIALAISMLGIFLTILPAIKGLFNWPIRLQYDINSGSLTTHSIFGFTSTISSKDIVQMQPVRYWHGGRMMSDGLVLHLTNGDQLKLTTANLKSIEIIKETIENAGIPLSQTS